MCQRVDEAQQVYVQKRLLTIAGLGAALLLTACGRAPSREVIEQAWQLEIVEPHLEEMAELLGPRQARDLITTTFEIKRITRLGGGVYGVDFQSSQQLMRPLSELAPGTPANVMRIVQSMFPSGHAGETVRSTGYVKLKQTDAGWIVVDRKYGF